MKKLLFAAVAVLVLSSVFNSVCAQTCYWVFLTDKAGTTFDPYSYFDAKAIERYKLNNADLYDITNYPLNEGYVGQIDAIVDDDFGQSRWFNAVAVTATPEQISRVESLPFVKRVELIGGGMQTASAMEYHRDQVAETATIPMVPVVTDQLMRMQGFLFGSKNIDGTGIRIAVFDGGFHGVDTHNAFKHLRDNGRIMATWDFTKKQPNVYDNHTHGTMVLSCIAGMMGDKMLGLATGASFLLAKTEVDPEPYKEEVWWAEAVEWADKNGADIINSSLGYTKDRHYTWEMDGRSRVSKAANLAARKGMLVCNSAGNSGDEEYWKIIGAPADADSILSVGGIAPSRTTYQHISFSSYGPTADGRLKPNVCNYGYAECADAYNDTATKFAAGTSFSSPLTAGFCACAMQAVRNEHLSAMQMKSLIEQSADLYPYYDYAFGYGVPQASFFTDPQKRNIEKQPTFEFKDFGKYVVIHAFNQNRGENDVITTTRVIDGEVSQESETKEDVVLFKIQDHNGLVKQYVNLNIDSLNDRMCVAIPKAAVYGHALVAHVNGYTKSYHLSRIDSISYADADHDFAYHVVDTVGYYQDNFTEYGNRTLSDNYVSNWGVGQRYQYEWYLQYGVMWFFPYTMRYSDACNFGFRLMRNFCKWYGVGLGFDFASQFYRYDPAVASVWDNTLAITDFTNVETKQFFVEAFNLELFQRLRLKNCGAFKRGLYWDLGIYGGLQGNVYNVCYNAAETGNAAAMQTNSYSQVEPVGYWNLGLTTRLMWDWIGLYGRYRLTQPGLDLPRLELGVQLSF